MYEAVTNEPLLFNGETMGMFTVDMNGLATVVFNDFIEKHLRISGTLEVLIRISEQVIVTEERNVITTPIKSGAKVEIPIIFQPSGSTIEKKGVPNRAYNTESIEWNVEFNKYLETINNAVLSDPIQADQELQAGSIKVYKLITKLDGSTTVGEELSSGFTIEKNR